jgi:hypothetical protein
VCLLTGRSLLIEDLCVLPIAVASKQPVGKGARLKIKLHGTLYNVPVGGRCTARNGYCEVKLQAHIKGTLSRDFRLLFFFMNQFPPSI